MYIKELQSQFSQSGTVSCIMVRPERMQPVRYCNSVLADAEKGLNGDRYRKNGNRQVTLIQSEHLDAVASFLGKPIKPDLARRNIVVKGINLLALKGKQFQIGDAILEYSGECHPCSRMEENLGPGGYNAMRGHGGITAKILKSGMINVHDSVTPIN